VAAYNVSVDAAKPLPPIPDAQLWDLFCRAEEIGLRLEMTDAGIIWETLPGLRHQELMRSVLQSVQPLENSGDCECYNAFDLAIRFPSGVAKRPDVAIFCKRPAEEEGFVYSVPEAVVEITSPGYEQKDLESGPRLYRSNGVKDVLVLDRRTGEVHHWTGSGKATKPSPSLFILSCGCSVTV
jgi:Uma2 family endonuclease